MRQTPSEHDLIKRIQKDAGQIPVPDTLKPEAVKQKLEESDARPVRKKPVLLRRILPLAGAAACFLLAVGIWQFGPLTGGNQENEAAPTAAADEAAPESGAGSSMTASSYEEIYKTVSEIQTRRGSYTKLAREEEMTMAETSAAPADGAAIADNSEAAASENSQTSFSTTNVQVENIEEEDIVKTDGHYLYHVVYDDLQDGQSIAIVKADGAELEEVGRISELTGLSGFYLQDNTLICVEQIWVDKPASLVEENARTYYSPSRQVTRVRFFDISDRSAPKEISSLTTEGYYSSSRISGGYFYLFCNYMPSEEAIATEPKTFVPVINDETMSPDSIILPEDSDTDCYLVAASVSLEEPSAFADSMAVLSTASQFYVSADHIYVADTRYMDENSSSDVTNLTMLSYRDGDISGEKSGSVKGQILDTFAMNEYNGYFRVVTTVTDYDVAEITDDRTGEFLGYSYENPVQTNSLYVLDENLEVIGQIEGLAEGERVYSARFMGDTGYFVTYQQIDPLYSVDLSDPANPRILGELKIPGFSEYLHFYSENLLLGIGYETDPDTQTTEGIKLSMFDISDPTDVKEVHKLVLDGADYSDALYDYKAVLIDPAKNLFGFPCQGMLDGTYVNQYRTYSYDPEKGFTEGIRWIKEEYTNARGAYIDDTFYVLDTDGDITAYSLETGQETGTLH